MTRQELWKIHDKIEDLKTTKALIGLNDTEDLELRNLEVKFNNEWADQQKDSF